jgi:hypothetical protein
MRSKYLTVGIAILIAFGLWQVGVGQEPEVKKTRMAKLTGR